MPDLFRHLCDQHAIFKQRFLLFDRGQRLALCNVLKPMFSFTSGLVWQMHNGPVWRWASCVCNPKLCKTHQISMVYMKYISLHGLSIKPPPYPTQLPLRFWGNGLWLLDLVCQLSFITFLCRMWATCWLVWLMEHLERSHVPDMGEVANSVWLPGDEIQMGCNLFPDHVSTRWTKMCATGTPFQTSITNGQQQSTKHTANERRAIIGSDVRSARIQQWLGSCLIILLALNNTAQVWQAVFEDLPKDKSLRVTNTKLLTNVEVYMKGN